MGDVEFRTRYCYCPNCLLNVSFQKMKKINRKVMLSYLQASLWGREMLKILVQSQALKKVPKNSGQMLGGRKTVICEFLGTGMISVMPVPLLSVHPRECSQQGHIRYVLSVCAYRWTCRVLPHKPPLQAL